MADFVVFTGLPPSEYWQLTTDEETALLQAFQQRNRRQADAQRRANARRRTPTRTTPRRR